MKKILLLSLTLLFTLFAGCNKSAKDDPDSANPNQHKVVVKEIIQVSSYTYAKVEEGSKEVWIAFKKSEIANGETLYFEGGMEMANFKSTELNRTFPSILFLDRVSKTPITAAAATTQADPHGTGMGGGEQPSPQKPVLEKEEVKIEKPAGGVAIGDLYTNSKSYESKVVKVKGKVTKYNAQILSKNWIHIQDGSGTKENFDLTITTDDEVKVGDIVTFQGKITLNKDFGSGYFYKLIMEDAKKAK